MLAKEMLLHTAELVGGQRERDYGDKVKSHARIAHLWNYWLNSQGMNSLINPYDVAMMMMLLKVARLMNAPGHADSHVDIAGYASILEEISSELREELSSASSALMGE
jgi:hypothetical protein